MKLDPQQKVLLVLTRGTVTKVYETRVRRITTYAVEVDHPNEKGAKIPFREGDPLLLVAEDGNGEHYFFDTLCLGLDTPESDGLTLLFQEDFLKLPGRSALRAIVNIQVRVTPSKAEDDEPFVTQSVNLSSSGILIASPYHLTDGARVRMELRLSTKEDAITVSAVRKRAEHPAGTGKKSYLLAFEFVGLGGRAQKKLVEFVQQHYIRTFHLSGFAD